MGIWQPYAEVFPATTHVQGDLRILTGVASPQLGNTRDILVYLPPSYGLQPQRSYPVIYMHDGQNLFDAATSYAGEWQVDETFEELAGEGIEAIVVGIPNAGAQRLNEYSPFRDPRHSSGQGHAYLRFLIDTVKPQVDAAFRTRPERASTGMLGSSMGGLISLYGFFAYPQYFGFVGGMSPSLWFARGRIMAAIRRCPPILGTIYFDYGTAEAARTPQDLPWMQNLLSRSTTLDGELYELLCEKGYRPGYDLQYIVEQGGGHNEAAWARRLPDAIRFLLAGRT